MKAPALSRLAALALMFPGAPVGGPAGVHQGHWGYGSDPPEQLQRRCVAR